MECIEIPGFEDSWLRSCYPEVIHLYTEFPVKIKNQEMMIAELRRNPYAAEPDFTFLTMWKFATAELRGHHQNQPQSLTAADENDEEENFYSNPAYYKSVNQEIIACSVKECMSHAEAGGLVGISEQPPQDWFIIPLCRNHYNNKNGDSRIPMGDTDRTGDPRNPTGDSGNKSGDPRNPMNDPRNPTGDSGNKIGDPRNPTGDDFRRGYKLKEGLIVARLRDLSAKLMEKFYSLPPPQNRQASLKDVDNYGFYY